MTEIDSLILKKIFVMQTESYNENIDPFMILDVIYNSSVEDIFSIIRENRELLPSVGANNIPQFSNADDLFSVLRIIIDSKIENITYETMGYFMCPPGAKAVAKKKYGENHYKLAVQLGLAKSAKPFAATDLGVAFYLMNDTEKQQNIKKKLPLHIPIIQQALLLADIDMVNMECFMEQYLAHSTVVRRRPNVRELISYIADVADIQMQYRLNNLIWSMQ